MDKYMKWKYENTAKRERDRKAYFAQYNEKNRDNRRLYASEYAKKKKEEARKKQWVCIHW